MKNFVAAAILLSAGCTSRAPPPVVKEFITGAWGPNGDCSKSTHFMMGGFLNNHRSRWRIEGETLVMTVDGTERRMKVTPLDDDHMLLDDRPYARCLR